MPDVHIDPTMPVAAAARECVVYEAIVSCCWLVLLWTEDYEYSEFQLLYIPSGQKLK